MATSERVSVLWALSSRHVGYCSLCERERATVRQEARVVATFPERLGKTALGDMYGTTIALCLACVRVLLRPRIIGKETRSDHLPGVILKRYRASAEDGNACKVCRDRAGGDDRLALWKGQGALILCAASWVWVIAFRRAESSSRTP